MVKIRLKRLGYKKNPVFRVVVLNSTTKREGRPIQELGFYNPKTKEMKFDKATALEWISKGAQPTDTVAYLLKNCNADGTLNYKKKDGVKLSKKAQAKAQAEAEAKAAERKEAADERRKKQAVKSVGNSVAGTVGREVGKQVTSGMGSFGKKLGGNVGASVGRGLFSTLFKL